MKPEPVSPVSFEASIVRLPQKGMPLTIEATAKQRDQLAEDHGLISVDSFRADLLVAKWKRDGVRVTGLVEARIEQACSISLEPIRAEIREEVDVLFVPEGSKLARPNIDDQGEILLNADGADGPEVFSGATIDVGAVAEEFFALGIDPYPRAEGATLPDGAPQEDCDASPFAKLASLKRES